MKLGRDQKINPIYGQCLKSFLATDTCVGVIGGKPKHSLYFVGFQDDNLIHLDPHLVQDKVDIFQEDFDLQSYHSKTPRKLALSKMDPSCCIGFLIETEHQFEGWCQMSSELATPSQRGHNYPMFTIVDGPNVPSVCEVLHDTRLKDPLRGSNTYFRLIGTQIRTFLLRGNKSGHLSDIGTYSDIRTMLVKIGVLVKNFYL